MRLIHSLLVLALAIAFVPRAKAQDVDAAVLDELIGILESRGIVTHEEAEGLKERGRVAAAQDAPEGDASSVRVTHEPDTGFTFATADGRFRTTLGGWLQLRATGTDFDDKRVVQRQKDDQGTFAVRRARLKLSGTAWRDSLDYAFEVDLADGAELKDAYALWRPRRVASLQLGQFKVPFSRQQLVSDRRQQFLERAVTDDFFAPGREPGVAWLGRSSSERHRWWVALTNGEGENEDNTDNQYRWTARYELSSREPLPSSESAEDGMPGLRWGLGLAAFRDVDRVDIDGDRIVDDDVDVLSGQLDLSFFGSRWSATGEWTWRESDPVVGPRDPAARDSTVRAEGFLLQAGAFVVPRRLELAARVARHSTDGNLFAVDSAREELLGVNWFLSRHGLKLSADAGRVRSHGQLLDPEVDDRRLRLQLQYSF